LVREVRLEKMLCIKCQSKRSKVVESRRTSNAIRRRRECLDCNERFTTFETVLEEKKAHREPMIKIQRRSKGKVYEKTDSFVVLEEDDTEDYIDGYLRNRGIKYD